MPGTSEERYLSQVTLSLALGYWPPDKGQWCYVGCSGRLLLTLRAATAGSAILSELVVVFDDGCGELKQRANEQLEDVD